MTSADTTLGDRVSQPGRSIGAQLTQLLNRHSYVFALALSIGLLIAYVSRTSHVNWTSLIANFSPVALAAIASTPAIVSGGGGFDVSISPIMILTTAVYSAWLVPRGLDGFASVPILLATGAAVGMASGMLINRLRVQPVVVTLSGYFILSGVNTQILPVPKYVADTWISRFAGPHAGFPGAIVLIAIPLVIWQLLGLLPYKRALYAAGSNDVAAFASGVAVGRVRVIAYGIGGLFAAIGGFAVLGVTSSSNATLSGTYTLSAVAAVALGGTSLWGGRGGPFGSVLGAASIHLLGSLFITLNANPSWLRFMNGAMLMIAVVLVGVGASRASQAKQLR